MVRRDACPSRRVSLALVNARHSGAYRGESQLAQCASVVALPTTTGGRQFASILEQIRTHVLRGSAVLRQSETPRALQRLRVGVGGGMPGPPTRIQRTSARWFGRRVLFQSLRASRRATSPRHDAMPSHTPATMAKTLPIQYEPSRPIAPSTSMTTATTICHRRRVLAAEFGGMRFGILSPSTMRAGSLV
jgi:hypothetical protein